MSHQPGRSRSRSYFLLFAFMLAPLLAGCGDPNRAKIVGSWEIVTADKVLRRLKDTEEIGAGSASRMRLEFRQNGLLTTATNMGSVQSSKKGQWEWLSYNEDNSTAQLKVTIGLEEIAQQVQFLDERTIELVPPNMAGLEMKVKFERSD